MGFWDFLKNVFNLGKTQGKSKARRRALKGNTKSPKKPKRRAASRIKTGKSLARKKPRPEERSSRRGKISLKKRTRKRYVRKPSRRPVSKPQEKEIGVITHYFGKICVGVVKLKGTLKLGDKIHIRGAHDDFVQVVSSMQINRKDITSAKRGQEVGIKVLKKVHENDKVYLARET